MPMKNPLASIVSRFVSFFRPDRRWRSFSGVARLDSQTEANAALNARQLIIVGSLDRPKWLKFLCPCGCGDTIALNLMESHYPRWRLRVEGPASISVLPSVDATKCGSHFWIKSNEVIWAEEHHQPSMRDLENT